MTIFLYNFITCTAALAFIGLIQLCGCLRKGDAPQAEPAITEYSVLAFAFIGLLTHLSSWLLSIPSLGFFIGCLGVIGVIAHQVRHGWKLSLRWDHVDIGILSVVSLIGLVYASLLLGLTDRLYLPAIYDLPKHLSAMYSAGSGGWPGANPYYPDVPFAYNLLFYQPWAVVAEFVGGGTAHITCFAWGTLWMGAAILGVLRRVSVLWGLGIMGQATTVFFASLAGGWAAFIAAGDAPESGYILAAQGKALFWVDDPFTYLVYVPQHVFAIAAIISASLLLLAEDHRPNQVGAAVCLIAAPLASLILAPLVVGATLWLGLTQAAKSNKQASKTAALFTFLTLSAIIPWLWVAKQWAGPEEAFKFGFLPEGSGAAWIILSGGIVVPLSIIGLYIIVKKRFTLALTWAAFFAGGIVFITSIHYPDSEIKGSLYLRLLAAPVAAVGVVWLINTLKRLYISAVPIVLALIFIPAFGAGLFGVGHYLSTFARQRPPGEKALIREFIAARSSEKWLIYSPSQDLPSVLGRPSYYDFRAREDRYVPYSKRTEVIKAFADLSAVTPSPEQVARLRIFNRVVISKEVNFPKWWQSYTLEPKEYGDYVVLEKAPSDDDVLKSQDWLKNCTWQKFGAKIAVASASKNQLMIEASDPTDSAFVSDQILTPGYYRIRLRVSGAVYGPATGGAHLSLHGQRKLLQLKPGAYNTNKLITLYIRVAPGESSQLSVGFGGWSTGWGTLELNALTVDTLRPPFSNE